MIRVYVSGPMRGYPRFNFDAFDTVTNTLRAWGHTVLSPAEHDRELYPRMHEWPGFATGDVDACDEFDLVGALRWDLQQVASADMIVMLPGWEESSGARHERYVAEVCDIEVVLAQLGPRGLWIFVRDDRRELVHLTSPPKRDDIPNPLTADDYARQAVAMQALDEERIVDPTTGGAKGRKLARFDLIPARPLYALAKHYGRGAGKYDDRNWERGYAWSLSFGALMRHLWAWWDGEDNDPELGSSHLDAAAFHVFGLREFTETHPEHDDRPHKEAS